MHLTDEYLKNAAHFHAFLWYSREHPDALPRDAVAFADDNWPCYLAVADIDLGRILCEPDRSTDDIAHVLAIMLTHVPDEPTCDRSHPSSDS